MTKLLKNCKFLAVLIAFSLTACESLDIVPHETDLYKEKLEAKGKTPRSATPLKNLMPGFFGNSSVNLQVGITYAVALEKFSIMPIMTADQSSGVITTDWYSTSTNTDERFKFNILIKDDEMNEESLVINMFKEKIDGGIWKTAPVNAKTAEQIHQTILKQSRKLKAAAEMS